MKTTLALGSLLLAGLSLLLGQDREDQRERRPDPVVGQAAAAFRLNDHTGRAVSVGGEAEHWSLLAFFPKAATPG